MVWLLGKRSRQEEERELISDILLNEPDGERRLNVQDYTRNPGEFEVDVRSFPLDVSREDCPFVKVKGLVAGLRIIGSPVGAVILEEINYAGLLLINNDFPLCFEARKFRTDVPYLAVEELILKSGKRVPITMTGRLFQPGNSGVPYALKPAVIQVGNYISPGPRQE
ncbi:hypothetical protein CMI37_22425 [Candidatus Pacearchaeota archaeon]|nr:hypothetical protein [Candidatus Pacearchaeota archaeon]|tara:strand:- start:4038 stop:4538 length:501 start_codon:yes stop_codon:yes gene_type:complete